MTSQQNPEPTMRQRAEAIFRENLAATPELLAALSPEANRQALYELQVHQIQLEMQNEELRQLQVDLDNSRARYFDLYDLAPVGYIVVARHGLILQANLTASSLLGLPRSALISKRFSRFILPASHDLYYRQRKQLFASVEPQSCELRMVKHDGTHFWAHLAATTASGDDGAPVLRIVLGDIDNLKWTEAKLLESEEFKDAILNSVAAQIAVIDRDGVIVKTNQAWQRFARENGSEPGKPARQTEVGINYLDVCLSRIGDRQAGCLAAYSGILNVLEGRTASFSLEYSCHSPHQQRWFTMSVTPLGEVGRGAVIAHNDISTRKVVEVELLRSNGELEQFSFAISHDMRQPLRMITSYLQLLETELAGQLDGDQPAYFNFAIDGAKRLDQMLVSLLEYSRIGRQGEPPAWIESRGLLDEALLYLHPAIAEAHADVRLAGHWPRILASPDEMLRLLQNLIGNALKFRLAGRLPEITVSSEVAAGRWHLNITDNGIGILPGQSGRLFQVFQRLHSRADYEGTGIGLALCRKIVEHHGGQIRVESAGAGQGSCFWVELPLVEEVAA